MTGRRGFPAGLDGGMNAMFEDRREDARRQPTLAEIKNGWPPAVPVPEAGAAFGLSRSYAYELVARGQFPAAVIKVGSRYRVLTESIIRVLSDGASQ
jgi:predicted DNA-binding transcriptional regulator AlpA